MAVDYITLDQIVDECVTLIGNSTAINDFCQTNYGKSILQFKSLDQYKLPTAEEAPYVAILKDDMDAGESVNTWKYQLGFEVGVKDINTETTTIGNSSVVEVLGEKRVEELTNLIYDEIRQNIPCNANVDEMRMMLDDTQYPLYVSIMVLKFNIPQVIGAVIGI
jgi:hypothetical protein